ncbi:hypothetical protein AAMO2058_000336400 [Amorphochlora amoebiformis]
MAHDYSGSEELGGERSDGKVRHLMEGLSLFEGVITKEHHDEIVSFIDRMLTLGQQSRLPGRTYTRPPPKWVGNKQSRQMLQFGVYTNANRVQPAALMDLPPLLEKVVDALERRGVITGEERTESCCVNVYEVGQWLPPHVDNYMFARPFVTVSLLSEQQALFGNHITGENGKWTGGLRVSMPVCSALRVSHGAGGPDVKHAVMSPTSRRISVTFRRLTPKARDEMQRNVSAKLVRKIKSAREKGQDILRLLGGKKDEKRRNKTKSTPLPQDTSNTLQEARRGKGVHMPEVERLHVTQVYDRIATHWNRTRHSPWPRVAKWLEENRAKQSLVVDVGCGNGKHLKLCGISAVGCDVSISQLKICRQDSFKSPEELKKSPKSPINTRSVLLADGAEAIPLRDEMFDLALNIAVLHHIATERRRRKMVQETIRILRPGGRALFYAWAFEQNEEQGARSGHRFDSQDVLVPWHFTQNTPQRQKASGPKKSAKPEPKKSAKPEPKSEAKSEATSEAKEKKNKSGEIYMRYCHVYKEGELESLFSHLNASVRIVNSFYDSGNWCVEVERL